MRKVWNIISTVLVAVVVILAVAMAGARLVGLDIYAVLSGSMEPTYHTGSVIYVKKVKPEDLKVGEAITFAQSKDTVVTHRIVEVVKDPKAPGGLKFRTKGDANTAVDGQAVDARNVIGRPVFTIPLLGYVMTWIQRPPGLYVAIAVACLLILLLILPGALSKKDKTPAEKERKDADPSDSEDR